MVHPECLPIPIPQGMFRSFHIISCHFRSFHIILFSGDPFYPPINITTGRPFCLAFTRSMPGQLTLGFREQMNQITSFADASNVYGSDLCEMVSDLTKYLIFIYFWKYFEIELTGFIFVKRNAIWRNFLILTNLL